MRYGVHRGVWRHLHRVRPERQHLHGLMTWCFASLRSCWWSWIRFQTNCLVSAWRSAVFLHDVRLTGTAARDLRSELEERFLPATPSIPESHSNRGVASIRPCAYWTAGPIAARLSTHDTSQFAPLRACSSLRFNCCWCSRSAAIRQAIRQALRRVRLPSRATKGQLSLVAPQNETTATVAA
jgi:hypothetical protein